VTREYPWGDVLLRMRIRTAMALAAVAAIALAVVKPLILDPLHWSARARYHEVQAEVYLERAELETENASRRARLMYRHRWHRTMASRYRRAAAYIGMPIPRETEPPPVD
jgi:hypothetical protein